MFRQPLAMLKLRGSYTILWLEGSLASWSRSIALSTVTYWVVDLSDTVLPFSISFISDDSGSELLWLLFDTNLFLDWEFPSATLQANISFVIESCNQQLYNVCNGEYHCVTKGFSAQRQVIMTVPFPVHTVAICNSGYQCNIMLRPLMLRPNAVAPLGPIVRHWWILLYIGLYLSRFLDIHRTVILKLVNNFFCDLDLDEIRSEI